MAGSLHEIRHDPKRQAYTWMTVIGVPLGCRRIAMLCSRLIIIKANELGIRGNAIGGGEDGH